MRTFFLNLHVGLLAAGIGCAVTEAAAQADTLRLPEPYATPSVRIDCKVIGWDGKKLSAPAGFTVEEFARGFSNPRWVYVAPSGDVFVSDAATETAEFKDEKEREEFRKKAGGQNFGSANRIFLFRDMDGDGVYEKRITFLEDLNQPLGMLALNGYFYVANTDGVVRFPYQGDDSVLSKQPEKIVELPAGGYNNHWTRNIITDPAGQKLYIAVGSASNNGEYGLDKEVRRANVLVTDLDGRNEEVYASGLRNPVGIDWNPVNGELWAAVNERDELGDELVPDYTTSVQRGGFYGWPYAYFGAHEDPRLKGQRPDLVEKTIVPDVPLGSHTASLGLTFYKGTSFPERYRNGLFIGQHGSWNRSELSGYKVMFVPFVNGKPSAPAEDFLTGFIADAGRYEVHGRPVCVATLPDGSLLVTDDAARVIWRVKYSGGQTGSVN